MERDEDVRTACFLALDVLQAQFGEENPYRAGSTRASPSVAGESRSWISRRTSTVLRPSAGRRRLLDDEDGPMLDLLKTFQGKTIELPRRSTWRPDPERLAERFDRFSSA